MKIHEDTIPNAKEVLGELMELQGKLHGTFKALRSFGPEEKATYGSLPKFFVGRRAELMSFAIDGFSMQYAHVNDILRNGRSSNDSGVRLNDGIYKLGLLVNRLRDVKFMVTSDNDCKELRDLAARTLGDFVVYIITQFGLSHCDEFLYLSVQDYCAKSGISGDIFYGAELTLLDEIGESVYGYESISPYRDDLMDIDAGFVAECEDAAFPLNESMCRSLIDGSMDIIEARAELQNWLQSMKDTEIEGISPLNIVEKMHLG